MSAIDTQNQYAKQDPTKQYPQPKFEEQTQSAPGLAQKMTPKPDHGEKSYRGFGRLAGRKALITGADSGIGRAAAIAARIDGSTGASRITHLAIVHHETTTGRLNELTALGEICRARGVELMVDGVSSFGAEALDFGDASLCAVAGTANKCLHGVPGASFVIVRRAALLIDAGSFREAYELLFALNRQARDVEVYNLERKPLVFATFARLADATRG